MTTTAKNSKTGIQLVKRWSQNNFLGIFVAKKEDSLERNLANLLPNKRNVLLQMPVKDTFAMATA